MNPKLRVAVLVSGHGSNLQALIDACAAPQYPAEIVLVISNVPTAYAIQRATAAGVAVKVIDHHSFAIDGPVLHRDSADPSLLHVYLLSYERHTLIGHLVVSLPT